MTGEWGPEPGRADGRWTMDEVADVHAGIHPPDEQARLLAEIDRDPQARRMLSALQGIVQRLSQIPAPRMPLELAARLDAAIAAQAAARVVPAQRSAPPVIRGELSSMSTAGQAQHDRTPQDHTPHDRTPHDRAPHD